MDVNKLREKLKSYIQDEQGVEAFISELDSESEDIKARNMIVRENVEEATNLDETQDALEIELDEELRSQIVAEVRSELQSEFDALNATITELTEKLAGIERSLQEVSKPIKEQVEEAVEKAPLARSANKVIVRPTGKTLVDENSNPVKSDGQIDITQLREMKRKQATISNLF